MPPLRVVAVGLAAVLCVVEARALLGRGGPGVVVAPVDTRVTTEAGPVDDGVEPAFLAHMTADDVARGVYGLAEVEGNVALTADQRARIRPLLVEGEALRARMGELRTARRAAREAWLATGGELAAVAGPAVAGGTR